MKIFNGIIGVMSIFGALHCILWEGTSFLNYGWTVTLIMLLWGICAIVTYAINRKETQKKDPNLAATGILGLIFGIAGCVISIVSMVNVEVQALFLLLIFVIFVVCMFVTGIRVIVFAKAMKAENPKKWTASLVIGILLILVGCGGLISWLTLNALSGVTMGVMLGVFGIAMLIAAFGHEDQVSIYDEIDEI